MPDDRIYTLRSEIDAINLELLALLSRRGKLSQAVCQLKQAANEGIYDPVREQAMLEALVAANQGPFDDRTIKSIFKTIFQASMQNYLETQKPQLLTSRASRADTVVQVGEVAIGSGKPPVLIAGPCAIESEAQVHYTAAGVAARQVRLFRAGAYKPRTSPYAFQGLGEQALRWARAACDRHQLYLVSEVMDAADLPSALHYVDVVQIGARNAQNFSLLKAVGQTDVPVLLKRGLSATIEEWVMAAEYVMHEGNPHVILCERGIRTFEPYTRNTLDISAVALAKQETHLPVIVDVTHSGGRRDLLVPLTKAALATGADGIMLEVHPNPAVALSDQKQQIDFDQFDDYLQRTNYAQRLSDERFELYP